MLTLRMMLVDSANQMVEPVFSKQVPAAKFPLSLLGWQFPEPGIFAGRPPSDEIIGKPWTNYFEHEFAPHVDELKRRTGHQGPVAVSVGRMEQDKFFRFLAKVAHAFAVAQEGFDTFEHLATDLIFGRSQAFCHLIGGDAEWQADDSGDETFRIAIGKVVTDDTTYICVFVQLYPLFQTPTYVVVVGKRERTGDEVTLLEKTTNSENMKLAFPAWKAKPIDGA